MTVRRFNAGVPPSKTKTGLVLRNRSLQILRKNPIKCAFCTISPFSSRIAFINCTIHILASAIDEKIKEMSSNCLQFRRITNSNWKQNIEVCPSDRRKNRTDGQSFPGEGFNRDATTHRSQQLPKTLHSHIFSFLISTSPVNRCRHQNPFIYTDWPSTADPKLYGVVLNLSVNTNKRPRPT